MYKHFLNNSGENRKKAEVNIIAHPRLDHMVPWRAQKLVKKAIQNFFEKPI